jgi:hypothetical protein
LSFLAIFYLCLAHDYGDFLDAEMIWSINSSVLLQPYPQSQPAGQTFQVSPRVATLGLAWKVVLVVFVAQLDGSIARR